MVFACETMPNPGHRNGGRNGFFIPDKGHAASKADCEAGIVKGSRVLYQAAVQRWKNVPIGR